MIHHIILTGGPAGGKTTALPLISEHYRKQGYDVYTVPEVATMFHANGVLLKLDPPEYHLALECAAYSLQERFECSLLDLAEARKKPTIILGDRGLTDLRAYCASDEMWDQVLGIHGVDESLEPEERDEAWSFPDRYHLVLHFTSTGVDAPQHFTNDNNPARNCTPEVAKILDAKTLAAWRGHPNRVILDNSTDFPGKISRAIAAIDMHLIRQDYDSIQSKIIKDKSCPACQTKLLVFSGENSSQMLMCLACDCVWKPEEI